MSKRIQFWTAVFVIALLSFSSCRRIKETYGKDKGTGAPGGQPAMAQVFAVNTTTAVKGQIRDYLALSGDILASSTVDTYSDAAGKVSRLYVSVGSRVEKNDPVAEVDPSRPGMDFVPSLVKAPVAGTIVALPAQMGMTVSQAVPLARISGGAGLEIRLHVAERFISKIGLNQACEITLDAYPGEIFRGSITEVSPTVDTVSRTMEIRVGVENPGSRLKAGMFAKVRIITESKEDIVKIPASAMVNRFGEQYVFAIDSGDPAMPVARKKIVISGILIDGVMEVRQGLMPGDEVVVRGQTLLEDGSRVNIIERLAPLNAN
jgi:multidrug efflux pump subunit AcrA (membrane-fusion protein)